MKRAVPSALKKMRGTWRRGDEEGRAARALKKVRGTRCWGDEVGRVTRAQKGERDTAPGR